MFLKLFFTCASTEAERHTLQTLYNLLRQDNQELISLWPTCQMKEKAPCFQCDQALPDHLPLPGFFEMSHVLLLKAPQRKSRKSGGSSHPSVPFPLEWDVQICFSLEQPLVHMACSWRECARLSGTHPGQGWHQHMAFPIRKRTRKMGPQVTQEQYTKDGSFRNNTGWYVQPFT